MKESAHHTEENAGDVDMPDIKLTKESKQVDEGDDHTVEKIRD